MTKMWNEELFEEVEKFLKRKRAELLAELTTVDELLHQHQEHHHPRHGHARLERIALDFNLSPPSTKENSMAPATGPVTLTSAGQKATASVQGFDQNGQPMPADFVMPAASFTNDNEAAATLQENADGETAEVTAVAKGVANISVAVTSAEGLALSDTQAVTVDITEPPPPTPVLTSVKLAFDTADAGAAPADSGATGQATVTDTGTVETEAPAPTEAPVDSNLTPNQKLAALTQK